MRIDLNLDNLEILKQSSESWATLSDNGVLTHYDESILRKCAAEFDNGCRDQWTCIAKVIVEIIDKDSK